MRRFALVLLVLVQFGLSESITHQKTLHGFVTAVNSPINFQIGEYTVEISSKKDAVTRMPKDFTPVVGSELTIVGSCREGDPKTKLTAVKIENEPQDDLRIEGTGLVEEKPQLVKSESGWSGTFAADGEILKVTPQTSVTMDGGDRPFMQDLVGLDTFAHYLGTRQPDNSILATKIEFRRSKFDLGESNRWKDLKPKVTYTDPDSDDGTLLVYDKKYTVLFSPEAQDYLGKLGKRLLPKQQLDLPDDSPAKIPFKFYVTRSDGMVMDFYRNGTVIVSTQVFDKVKNEAQLAFVLARGMSRVIEMQGLRTTKHNQAGHNVLTAATWMTEGMSLGGSTLVYWMVDKEMLKGLARQMELQADRMGLQYMAAAGYDPHEASAAMRAITKGDSKFYQGTYLDSQLALRYSNQSYAAVTTGAGEYQKTSAAIQAALHHKKKKKA